MSRRQTSAACALITGGPAHLPTIGVVTAICIRTRQLLDMRSPSSVLSFALLSPVPLEAIRGLKLICAQEPSSVLGDNRARLDVFTREYSSAMGC